MADIKLLRETLDVLKKMPRFVEGEYDEDYGYPEGEVVPGELELHDADGNLIMWDQASWREPNTCGTACCFAGLRAELDLAAGLLESISPNNLVSVSGKAINDELLDSHLDGMHVENYARDRFGLTMDESDYLFSGGNSMRDLIVIVNRLEKGADLASPITPEEEI